MAQCVLHGWRDYKSMAACFDWGVHLLDQALLNSGKVVSVTAHIFISISEVDDNVKVL